MLGLSQPTWNICQLGVVFFFNFFSFFTLSSLSQTIVQSVSQQEGINEHAGYYAAFITYLVFTIGHFVATPIVEIITPKWSIVSGLIGYAMFEAAFFWMNEYFLYFSAACAGFSGSLLWTGQFDYLAQNCEPQTLDRHSSNLLGLTQTSLIAGGAYLLIIYRFQTESNFELPLIRLIIGSFLTCTLIAIAIALFLPKPCFKAEKHNIPYFKHLSEIAKISFDRNLLLLFFTFCYSGLELSFFSAVFPTMVSFTKALGNTRDLNAIASIFVGIGNVSAIVLICGFLLGVGDTIFNQQCYTILSDIYSHDKRIEAFAVYRFYQSAASCVAMFYSAYALLRTHIIVLSIFCILGTVTFFGIRLPDKLAMIQSGVDLEQRPSAIQGEG
uniref:Uncharacterized protein n=1 Tax=Caenorhabditis japonica TaxID=281687 RepID=A0A8R1HYI3_CAEJA